MINRLLLSLLVASLMGCAQEIAPKTTDTAVRLTLVGLPISLTVKQRSTAAVPGSGGQITLTSDDITNGQVLISLNNAGGPVILGTTSMRKDDRQAFKFDSVDYVLTLTELNNALIGEDFATFRITTSAQELLSENDKIERLIEFVASMHDASFVRNDKTYSSGEAAKHLRSKWQAVHSEITTARQFIDDVASHSSVTGQNYTVSRSGGAETDVAVLLRGRLTELEKAR